MFLSDEIMQNIVYHTNQRPYVMKEVDQVTEPMNSKEILFKVFLSFAFEKMWQYIATINVMWIINKTSQSDVLEKRSTPTFTYTNYSQIALSLMHSLYSQEIM